VPHSFYLHFAEVFQLVYVVDSPGVLSGQLVLGKLESLFERRLRLHFYFNGIFNFGQALDHLRGLELPCEGEPDLVKLNKDLGVLFRLKVAANKDS